MPERDFAELSHEQLLRLAKLQTDVIESGLDYEHLKWLIAREVHTATESSGAVVEAIDGDEMVYEAVSGVDDSLVGLRINATGSLSGLAVRE